jgi:uncharacterized protein YjbJ (UPF0337 family)
MAAYKSPWEYRRANCFAGHYLERRISHMNKDRIVGAAKEAKGAVKEAVGKAAGDTKMTADGKADKIEGKVQNAVGGLKDALKK